MYVFMKKNLHMEVNRSDKIMDERLKNLDFGFWESQEKIIPACQRHCEANQKDIINTMKEMIQYIKQFSDTIEETKV